MKRVLTVLLLLIIIFPLVLSQETVPTITQDSEISQLSALKGGLNEKTENMLEREMVIPNTLQFPLKTIFGINTTVPITIERFAILLATWITFFIIIQGILKILPIINKGWQSIGGSLIITALIAMTGTINQIVIFYFELGDDVEWISFLGPFQLIPALIIGIILIVFGNIITHKIEKNYLLERARNTGERVSLVSEIGKKIKSTIS